MIAALPMYMRVENRAAHDALWAGVRAALDGDAPGQLSHELTAWESWRHPDLLLGQCCIKPYREHLSDALEVVATADYGLPGAAPGHYYSVFVVRAEDAASVPEDHFDRRFAFNGPDNHSGWSAAQDHAALHGRQFAPTLETGAHVESARAVAEGRADIACIDAVSWRGIERWDRQQRPLAVIGRSAATPGIAFVTRRGGPKVDLRHALDLALDGLAPAYRDTLGIAGLADIPEARYRDRPASAA